MVLKTLAGTLICLSSLAFAQNLQQDTSSKEDCPNGKKTNRITARHIEGGGIGYNQGYTTLEGFFSLNNGQVLPFLDVRGHAFNDGKFAANAGLGVRGLLTSVVLGGNVYYDYRQTHHFHYNQMGMGFEVLGAVWEGRLNGYLPVGRKQSHPYDKNSTSASGSPTPFFDAFINNSLLVSLQTPITTTQKNKVEFAMKGVDAEVGAHFFSSQEIDLYAAIGPYYFQGYHNKKAIGGKARITANFTPYVSVSGVYSNDSLFHSRVQGELALNFSFGPRRRVAKNEACRAHATTFQDRFVFFGRRAEKNKACCADATALQDRFVQPVWRQEIIVKSRKKQTFVSESMSTETVVAVNPTTGAPWNFLFVNNTSSSDGTFESPFSNLAAAQNSSNPNDVIYVYPGDGTTTGLSSGYLMKPGQQLLGTSLSHSFDTQVGAVSVPAMSTEMPHLTATDAIAVTIADTCTVSGLFVTSTITSTGGPRLSAIGNTTDDISASIPPLLNPVVTNNRIEQTANFNGECSGIRLVNITGLGTVSNNQLVGAAADLAGLTYRGIYLVNSTTNGSLLISNNNVSLINTLANRLSGITATATDNSVITSQIENNQVSIISSGALDGILANCNTEAQHTTLIQNNTVTGSENGALNATAIRCQLASPGSIISGQILSNTTTLSAAGPSTLQTGIMLDLTGGASADLLVQNNTTRNAPVGVNIRNNLTAGGSSSVRILDNILNGNTYAAFMSAASGTLCTKYQNNNALSNASIIQCTQSMSGVFLLEPLIGDTGTLSTSGTITNVAQDFCGN